MILATSPLITGLMPEIILAIGASLILLVGLIPRRQHGHFAFLLSLVFVILALCATVLIRSNPSEDLVPLNQDGLVGYSRFVALAIGLLIILANRHVPLPEERHEFFGLILFSVAGISTVAIANDLILLFLALELVSVPTYILIGLSRRSIQAQEATGKYFFLGAFAAALTLYGFSFIYGAAGTLQLFSRHADEPSITRAFATHALAENRLAQLGLLLSLAGLAFKLAAFPLHFYVADVYQGAAAPIAGMLGFVPKFAGFLGLIRILSLTGWAYSDNLFWLLAAMAATTMIVGNTLALMQYNVKRMLAYSSVAHSGYMLVALTAGPGTGESVVTSPLRNGLAALLWYMAVYGVMNLGAFAVISYLRKPGDEEEESIQTLDDLSGAARKHPWACLALSICVLGLMGFPLTGGFLGKFYVFSAAISSSAGYARNMGMLTLVIFGMLNSAIAAAYYLRIIATCYLDKPAEGVFVKRDGALAATLALCAIIVVGSFIRPSLLFSESKDAVVGMQVTTSLQPPTSAQRFPAPSRASEPPTLREAHFATSRD